VRDAERKRGAAERVRENGGGHATDVPVDKLDGAVHMIDVDDKREGLVQL